MSPTPLQPAAEAATLAQLLPLLAGLYFLSESDAPLTLVSCPRPAGELPNADLLSALQEPADAPVQVVELGYFLRNHTAADGVLGSAELAGRYRALQAFMEQNLREVHVYRVRAAPELHAYALGQVAEGQLAGFRTVLIET